MLTMLALALFVHRNMNAEAASVGEYVQQSLRAGQSEAQLRKSLRDNKYHKHAIDHAIYNAKVRNAQEYVRKKIASGEKPTDIKEELTKAGWSKKDINTALKAAR